LLNIHFKNKALVYIPVSNRLVTCNGALSLIGRKDKLISALDLLLRKYFYPPLILLIWSGYLTFFTSVGRVLPLVIDSLSNLIDLCKMLIRELTARQVTVMAELSLFSPFSEMLRTHFKLSSLGLGLSSQTCNNQMLELNCSACKLLLFTVNVINFIQMLFHSIRF